MANDGPHLTHGNLHRFNDGPQRLIERFVARGVPVLQVYGSTETCPIAVYTRLAAILRVRARAACRAYAAKQRFPVTPATSCRRAPRARSPCGAPTSSAGIGALNNHSREALHKGWYLTADIGRRDADGYFGYNRKRNLIISGGEKIYPAEVERTLLEHPDVADCAVVGCPDARWDEEPIAYVISRPGGRLDAEAVTADAGSQLARL